MSNKSYINQNGFIPMFREYKDSWMYKESRPFSKWEAFEYLWFECAFKPHKKIIDSIKYELDYGQLVTSQRFLKVAWRWKSKTKIENFLRELAEDGEIVVEKYKNRSRITVCKLATYYILRANEKPTEGQREANEKPTEGQREAKTEEGKENKKERIPTTTNGFVVVAADERLIISFFEKMKTDEIFIEHCMREYRINEDQYHGYMRDFWRQTKALETITAKKYQELKQHFYNWVPIRQRRKNGNGYGKKIKNNGQGIVYPNSIALKIDEN